MRSIITYLYLSLLCPRRYRHGSTCTSKLLPSPLPGIISSLTAFHTPQLNAGKEKSGYDSGTMAAATRRHRPYYEARHQKPLFILKMEGEMLRLRGNACVISGEQSAFCIDAGISSY